MTLGVPKEVADEPVVELDMPRPRSISRPPVINDAISNPTHDTQYTIHQGSRGISPPPGFDDSAVPSYSASSTSIPDYDPPPTARSLDETERDPMTTKFMDAHIARHGSAALSPLALLTPDQTDTLPEYVVQGTSFDEQSSLRGRNRQERPLTMNPDAQESLKAMEAMGAVRALEEREALEAIKKMEEESFNAEQVEAIRSIGDAPEDYYSTQELVNPDEAELFSMLAQYSQPSSQPMMERHREQIYHRVAAAPVELELIHGLRIDPKLYRLLVLTGHIEIPLPSPVIDVAVEVVVAEAQPQYLSSFGGHGVKRKLISADAARIEQTRNAQKAIVYKELSDRVMLLRKSLQYDQEALDLTMKVLSINPEFYTIWNYRREIMLNAIFPSQSDDEKQALLTTELKRLQAILRDYPKVYWIWTHRKWCLSQLPYPDWSHELLLIQKLLEQDGRNYHVWEYRRYIIAQLEKSEESSRAMREMEYTKSAINHNFSNFSAWHNRTTLLPKILELTDPDDRENVKSAWIKDELEFLRNAIYTDPEDGSTWPYHAWLLSMSPTSIQSEISMIDDLLLEGRTLVPLQAKARYLNTLGIRDTALIDEIMRLDPLRKERYRDTLPLDQQVLSLFRNKEVLHGKGWIEVDGMRIFYDGTIGDYIALFKPLRLMKLVEITSS